MGTIVDADNFIVVKNQEGQYSIWPVELMTPAGWEREPMQGPKEECLQYVRERWTDMRPLSLQRAMAAD